MHPVFLDLHEVIEIHRDQIAHYGGRSGVRDMALLQAAVAMPQASFGGRYLHTDLFEMAAAYLFHITQDHPFVDGNKRVGAAAALVFLALNGVEARITNHALGDMVLAVAQGKVGKAALADFLRNHSRR